MQSLMYRGYRISGTAKEWAGKWNVFCEIEKPAEPLRRCSFVVGGCSIADAEDAALQQGVKEVASLTREAELQA